MYKLFLTLRYLYKRRIAYFAIAAVTLCTAMVLVVMSVMGGFLDQLKTKARGLLGDIIIDNRSYAGFPLYDEFIAEVSGWPEVVKATPVIHSFGLLRFPGTASTHTLRVVGIRLDDVFEINAFKASLYYEQFYPGTTNLGPQQQPLIGYDLSAPEVEWREPDGTLIGITLRPILPPPYQQALEQSWAAGVRDEDTPDTELAALCKSAGLPVVVGQYQLVAEQESPWPHLVGDAWPGLIIGRDIVAQRLPSGAYKRYAMYPRGCAVTVTLLPMSHTGVIDTPIKQAFRYSDDSRTGIYEIDSQSVYCDFDLLQRLLLMHEADRVDPETGEVIGMVPARCSQIQMKIQPRVNGRAVDPRALAQRLAEHYHRLAADPRLSSDEIMLVQGIEALTWEQSQEHIIAPVEKERQLVTVLFAIISLVAGFLVLCILYMIVLQKTRDIGIVKAIGGSPVGLAAIFVLYGSFIGVVGSVFGSIFGCYFVRYINEIQEFLTRLNPAWQVWDRSVYSFDAIPNTVRPADVAAVIIAAIAAATLGSLLAALRAGFQQPVEALRYE